MPEQKSGRNLPVTTSPIENPFATEIYPYGLGGLNLKDQLDRIPVGQFSRHTNLIHTKDRGAVVRNGLTTLATGGANHHSVRRLADPEAATYTRIWGTDQDLRIGQSGALAVIDSGYSGDPLYLLPHRPPLSGDPWMFVADRIRMRKVRADGLDIPIGLPAPGSEPVLTLDTEYYTPIAGFDPGFFGPDGTNAAAWTGNAGFDFSDPPIATAAPSTTGNGGFIATPGGAVADAATGFYTFWGLAKTMDLSIVRANGTGAPKDASDDDIIQITMLLAQPQLVTEVRLYLVCSNDFSATTVPGTAAGLNTDFYVKAFKPSDFAPMIASEEATIEAAETARTTRIRKQSLQDDSTEQGFAAGRTHSIFRVDDQFLEQRDPYREQPNTAGGAIAQFTFFGTIGVPLRRGDFKRYGTTTGRDWSTITGLILYYQANGGAVNNTEVDFLNWRLTGGSGPDTMEPGTQSYDYRYTHYDPRTGAEGNPSPIMDDDNFFDSLRRGIIVAPAAYGDGAVRQRIYRRGGSLIDNWFFVGQNSSDGGTFTDEETDDGITDAGTVNLDHYEPVPTVDDAGTTVLAQPVPVIFGPVNGLLFALGDPHRPGHLYWCIPDQPDHWPAESNFEVCAPSEELMAGFLAGSQAFCFSRERLYAIYPNLSSAQDVSVTTTACRRGIVSRHAWAVGLGGIYGVAKDGIFQTSGGAEQIISHEIFRLFEQQTWNGYAPIDFNFPLAIRLAVSEDLLYFQYQATDGNRYVLVYSLIDQFWTIYDFAIDTSYMLPDDDGPAADVLVGGLISGKSYTHDGFSDDGVAIDFRIRTGCWDLGRPREDKLLGDQILDVDTQGVTLTLVNRLNNETVVNPSNAIIAAAGRTRVILDPFGIVPQRARNVSTEITGSSSIARTTLYFMGLATIPEPDLTVARVTQWDDLGHPDESYITGLTFDCDTGGREITVFAERDFGGQVTIMDTLVFTCAGRRKIKFSWADPATNHGFPAHKVRIRPEGNCEPWILYRLDWISVPEPPRIATWDIHFEADGDQYYTGLDLYCDTNGEEKRIVIEVDNVPLSNSHGMAVPLAYWPVTTNGRQWIHFTLPWGRGHVFHFHATDENPGLLYKHHWHLAVEPSEQANWNQNFSIDGTLADKWYKAFLFEVDTFGQNKTVEVQLDGVTVETFPVNTNGRKVVHHALTEQKLGRVLRVFPVDGNPSRPYTILPIFDVEPYKLNRWETQETDHDQHGFQIPIQAQVTIKSTAEVTLHLTTYLNQGEKNRPTNRVTDTYVIPSTRGVKEKRFVPFKARKGVLFKYLFTVQHPADDFWLYEEESSVLIQPWGAESPILVRPFGNDDEDRTRQMVIATSAAARSGGGT